MGARELLDGLRDAGLSVNLLDDRIMVAPKGRLTDGMRESIRAHRAELIAALTPPPAQVTRPPAAPARIYRLTREQGDEAHAEPWPDEGIVAFNARRERFLRRGFNDADADDLAEQLALRDTRGDDLRMCVECSHLGDAGRCLAAAAGRVHGADRRLEPVQTILQRCEAFGLRKGHQ